ncbi:MAG: PTS sugar transporter subunit IIA [Treponema sp.]|jgi:mannitol/fructose-specific phosphotransferase system IIA component (Ntr-type)|nr:PTS sugar transporter subunit IIA [Treponema sp.]
MLLSDIFDIRHIKPNLESRTKDGALEELIEAIAVLHPELDRQEMLDAVSARENLMNTAVMPGVAVPHGYCRISGGVTGAVGISRGGIEYDADDHSPVHCIFLVILGGESRENHLYMLSRLLKLFNSQGIPEIEAASSAREIYDVLRRF